MRRTMPFLFAVMLLAAPLAAGAEPHSTPAPVDHSREDARREGWPDTRAGELGYRWVHAFATGETAMKEFLARDMAPRSLQDRGVPQRVEKYRALREKYGKLSLVSVVKEAPGQLTVKLIDSDQATHDFVFTVESGPPFKLVSVGMLETAHGFGGFHH